MYICIIFFKLKHCLLLMSKILSVLNFCFVSGNTSSHTSAGEERKALKEKSLHLKYIRTPV